MPDTLLLADDSATIQRVIEMTFAEEDIRVVTVADGREAIERIASDPPDIVLADTNMPEKDGYDVSAFVKADRALSHIPVVLLTGAFEPVDGGRAREVGCDAVLVKPFEPKAVISRVRELLGTPRDADAVTPAAADATSIAAPAPAIGDSAPSTGSQGATPGAAAPSEPSTPVPAGPDAPPAAPDGPPAAPESAPAADAQPAGAAGAVSAPSPTSPPPADPEAVAEAEAAAAAEGAGADEGGEPGTEAAAPAAPEAEPAGAGESSARPGVAGEGAPPAPAVPAVEAPAPPSLADAFASLLAAEQGDPRSGPRGLSLASSRRVGRRRGPHRAGGRAGRRTPVGRRDRRARLRGRRPRGRAAGARPDRPDRAGLRSIRLAATRIVRTSGICSVHPSTPTLQLSPHPDAPSGASPAA